MAGSNRFLLMGLAFIALVGLFLFVQRERAGVVQEISPTDDGFEATVSEPRLIAPADTGAIQSGAGANIEPAASAAGATGEPATVNERVAEPAPMQPQSMPDSQYSGNDGVAASSGPATSNPVADSGSATATPQGGPGAGMTQGSPATEMISLPPSGVSPESGSVDMGMLAPEQGSIDSAIAPEAGSSGVMGPAPELLPVTHPGPSGELPGDSGPPPSQ